MLISRRLVLASTALVLGLSACGSANTTTSGPAGGAATATTGAPAGPKVINFGAAGGGDATAAMSESADKMMAIRNLTYVFDGTLPTLSNTGGSWQIPTGFTPDGDRVAAMAAALGVEGDLRELPADQGGGWMVGPQDYSSATLTVSADALGSWWFNAAPAPVAAAIACEMPAYDPAAVVTTSDGSTDNTEVTETFPVCAEPTPPADVPDEADALRAAEELFTGLGYDAVNYDYEFFGDEWSANVTAYLLLDGQRTPLSLTVGFGAEGVVSWASGSLATPVPADAYPLAGVQTGIDRLNDQAQQWMTLGMGYADSTMRLESSADMPVQCDPAADCGPMDTTPITVHLTSVKTDLTMVWDADNTVWLLPAYTFGDADGGQYTVIAVTDEYLQRSVADVVPEPPITDVVGTDIPADTTPADGGSDAIGVDAASLVLVGLSEADATAAAEANGWTLRVSQRDGEALAVTLDYLPSRVNVAVDAGSVVAVQSIG